MNGIPNPESETERSRFHTNEKKLIYLLKMCHLVPITFLKNEKRAASTNINDPTVLLLFVLEKQ